MQSILRPELEAESCDDEHLDGERKLWTESANPDDLVARWYDARSP